MGYRKGLLNNFNPDKPPSLGQALLAGKLKFLRKNICEKYFRDTKMTLMDSENVYL
jgi:hypothetical protein